jgi:integrase/recombinase XerD
MGSTGPPSTASSERPSGDTLGAWIDAYVSYCRSERGLSPNTVAAYRRDLSLWSAFCADAHVDPAAPAPAELTEFLRRARAGEAPVNAPLAPASVARAAISLRGLYRFLAREGEIPSDPTERLGVPRRGRPLPKAISVEDVAALVEAPPPTLLGRRDRALLETLYGAGLRISELVGLDVDDVDLEGRWALARGGKGGRDRRVPLGGAAVRALEDYLIRSRPELARRARGASAAGALWLNSRGARLSRQGGWKIIATHARAAGLEGKVSPHVLRHSFATHLLDGGADVRVVQELLGHASLATTQVYTLVTDPHLVEVFRSAHPRATV